METPGSEIPGDPGEETSNATAAKSEDLEKSIAANSKDGGAISTVEVLSNSESTASIAAASASVNGIQGQPIPVDDHTKCINFFKTLIRLATERHALGAIRLVEYVLAGVIDAKAFTDQVQVVLNSKPQPHLLLFLSKTLPSVQESYRKGEFCLYGGLFNAPTSAALPDLAEIQKSQCIENLKSFLRRAKGKGTREYLRISELISKLLENRMLPKEFLMQCETDETLATVLETQFEASLPAVRQSFRNGEIKFESIVFKDGMHVVLPPLYYLNHLEASSKTYELPCSLIIGRSGGAKAPYVCGDVVIHPSRPWPWIGVVQQEILLPICAWCGDLKVPKEWQKDGLRVWVLPDGFRRIKLCQHEGSGVVPQVFAKIEVMDRDVAPSEFMQVKWIPTNEISYLDGTEEVVSVRNFWHGIGALVRRKNGQHVGLCTELRGEIDALVVGDYYWTIHVPVDALQVVLEPQISNGNTLVLYEGFVGIIRHRSHKFTMRMENGYEFVWSPSIRVCRNKYLRDSFGKLPVDLGKIYPGQKLKAHLSILKTAEWPSDHELPEEMKEKVRISIANSSSGNELLSDDAEQVHVLLSSAAIDQAFISGEDIVSLTVEKVELHMIQVEWVTQLSPAAKKLPDSTLKDAELQGIKLIPMIRSDDLSFHAAFELFRYTVKDGDCFKPVETWRSDVSKNDSSTIPSASDSPSPPPSPGDSILLMSLKSSVRLDVLWENDHHEKLVEITELDHVHDNSAFVPSMLVVDDEEAVDGPWKKLGVVKSAVNEEKYATVAWYEKAGQEVVLKGEEDVGVYDLLTYYGYHHDYGHLVRRRSPSTVSPDNANWDVGYVLWSNSGGSTMIKWFEGHEESLMPWDFDPLCSSVCPQDDEEDDIIELANFDYSVIPRDFMLARVSVLVPILKGIAANLAALFVALHNVNINADRIPFVKIVFTCNNACYGLTSIPLIRHVWNRLFGRQGSAKAPTLYRGHFWPTLPLIWPWGDLCKVWLRAMQRLESGIKRVRAESGGETISISPEHVNMAKTDEATDIGSVVKDESELEEFTSKILTYLENATAVLSRMVNASPPSALLDATKMADWKTWDPLVSSAPKFASAASSINLMDALSKTEKLDWPCFCARPRSEIEMKAVSEYWPSEEMRSSKGSADGLMKKSASDIVTETTAMIQALSSGQRSFDFAMDDVLAISNSIADAMCLSILSANTAMLNEVANSFPFVTIKEITNPVEMQLSSNDDRMDVEDAPASERPKTEKTDDLEERNGADGKEGSTTIAEEVIPVYRGSFEQLAVVPSSHAYFSAKFDRAQAGKVFVSAVFRNMKLLESSLPPDIFVKTYEDRMDLLSCMIIGPQGTPYADGCFFFDVHLKNFPSIPPKVFYRSMSRKLNPNLNEDGSVCLSLLGTWQGKEATETWTSNSTLLQLFVSIQGLILVPEPYFNEAGYEGEKGKPESVEKSREYNEFALLLTIESLLTALKNPPAPFENDLKRHILENGQRILRLVETCQDPEYVGPMGFPLLPINRGYRLSLRKLYGALKEAIMSLGAFTTAQ